jgi:hypothetical protein
MEGGDRNNSSSSGDGGGNGGKGKKEKKRQERGDPLLAAARSFLSLGLSAAPQTAKMPKNLLVDVSYSVLYKGQSLFMKKYEESRLFFYPLCLQ